jgi:hypothetical protein
MDRALRSPTVESFFGHSSCFLERGDWLLVQAMHHLGVPEQVVQSICIPQSRSAEAEPVRVEAELLPGLGVISHAETLAGARGRSLRGKGSPGPVFWNDP